MPFSRWKTRIIFPIFIHNIYLTLQSAIISSDKVVLKFFRIHDYYFYIAIKSNNKTPQPPSVNWKLLMKISLKQKNKDKL